MMKAIIELFVSRLESILRIFVAGCKESVRVRQAKRHNVFKVEFRVDNVRQFPTARCLDALSAEWCHLKFQRNVPGLRICLTKDVASAMMHSRGGAVW